ncbi:hypothetical protein ACGFZP_33660 [Kitasatospora sp. NPDC048239]|uniref:hypothetical protein n=1 Tax=Kitasatospora sp. NPDC048239 TaxID=3364046 RepID=UPI003711CA10
MRSARTRTLLAGAAVAAVLAVGSPLAFADGTPDQGANLTWQEKQEKAASPEGQKTWEEKQSGSSGEEHKADSKSDSKSDSKTESKGEESKGEEYKAPHGGVHTGGGGLALSGGGLASGAVLLLGGLGAGAIALRRGRRTAGAAI